MRSDEPREMQTSRLDARTRLSIELAFVGHQGGPALMRRQEQAAMRLGMCGAEVDAARAGRSFDRRITRALELALAAGQDDQDAARSNALQAGIDESACDEIMRLARTRAHAAGSRCHG